MYEIKPEKIKAFIEDGTIKFPRFQRKQTWDDKKNFLLTVSIFKGYPLGVSILNIEKSEKGELQKWLLDGRQRRNALIKMNENPENIYNWAQKYLKFKKNDQIIDLKNKFYEGINEYIDDEKDPAFDEGNEDISEEEEAEEIEKEEDVESLRDDIDFLCHIICCCHNKQKKYSGFTRPFDFTKYFENLFYVEVLDDGTEALNGTKLRAYLKQYNVSLLGEKPSVSNFVDFINRGNRYRENAVEAEFKQHITTYWDSILERINIIERIERLLENAYIGLIEIKEIKSKDSQKIFNIINTGGTKLTAAEILSAKPSWNKKVQNPSQELIDQTRKLYKELAINHIESHDVVKWDVAATFIKRLKDLPNSDLIFPKTLKKDDETTLGFKILSAIFQDGIKKDDIEYLSENKKIIWNTDIDKIVSEYKIIFKYLSEMEYFKSFKMWKLNVKTLLSDAIMINFMVNLYKDYKRKDLPASGLALKKFQKNAFIMLDKFIYEYIIKTWRGSGDSKVAKNLKAFNSQPEVIQPLAQDKWISLLQEIDSNYSVDGEKILTHSAITPIIYHCYCLQFKIPEDMPTQYDTYEIDHLISQSLFDSSTITDRDVCKNGLYNLCPLSKEINDTKKEKPLNQISSLIDKKVISKNAGININNFERYSDVNNYLELKEERREFYVNSIRQGRETILNN